MIRKRWSIQTVRQHLQAPLIQQTTAQVQAQLQVQVLLIVTLQAQTLITTL